MTTFHAATDSGDDLLRKFWQVEEPPTKDSRVVQWHFEKNHYRNEEGRFVVPLPKDPHCKVIGESRTQP